MMLRAAEPIRSASSSHAEPKIRRKSLVRKLPSLFAAIAVIVLIGVLRMIVDRFEVNAVARLVRCPLLPTLPRHRQDRPYVLPRIPRSWIWPGNPRETLSECHGRQAPRLEHLQPRTFARPPRSLRSVANPDRGSSGPDRRSYEARAAHRS